MLVSKLESGGTRRDRSLKSSVTLQPFQGLCAPSNSCNQRSVNTGVLDTKSRLSSFEERLKKLVLKALNEKSLDLDAYTYHADKYGKLLTGGPNRATTNAKRRKMDFYWREWHLCLLYFFFSIADDELRLHDESFLILPTITRRKARS